MPPNLKTLFFDFGAYLPARNGRALSRDTPRSTPLYGGTALGIFVVFKRFS